MSSKTTTFVVRIDNKEGFDARATGTMAYSHAVVVGNKGEEAALSWHTSKQLASKAAETARGKGWTTARAVEAEAHNGGKATVVKRLAAELAETKAPAKKATAKKATAKKAAAPAKAKGSEFDPKSMKGYRVSTKSRSSKTTAVLVDGIEAGLNVDKGRWVTICLDHDAKVNQPGQRVARDVLGHPEEWCPKCRRAFAKA